MNNRLHPDLASFRTHFSSSRTAFFSADPYSSKIKNVSLISNLIAVFQNLSKSEKNRTEGILWFNYILVTDMADDDSAISGTYQIISFESLR